MDELWGFNFCKQKNVTPDGLTLRTSARAT
jgi:hypothetical protein